MSYVISGGTRTTLSQISLATNPFTYTTLGITSSTIQTYNSLGYRQSDGYFYAMVSGNIIRVGSDGSAVSIGPPTDETTGLPVTTVQTNNGAIGMDGYFYLRHSNPALAGTLHRIDLSTFKIKSIPLFDPTGNNYHTLQANDFAWVGDATTGLLYAPGSSGQLHSINPRTGEVKAIGPLSTPARSYGSVYGAQNGLFGNDNNGGLYQFNLTTGEAFLLGASPASASNDGANCAAGNITLGSDLSVTKTDNATTYQSNSTVTYTIVASNAGPFGAFEAKVNDPLPAGITTASWTCAPTTAGASGPATCGAASGTGALTDALVNLPVGASATFTVTLTVPPGRSGALVNTVTISPGPTNVDPKADNDSATDTDTFVPVITPVTESGTAVAGTPSTPIANVASNDNVNGAPATLGASGNATVAQSGTWPAGITLDTATGAISTTAAVPPGVYPVTYELCDKLAPPNCKTMEDTVTVSAQPTGVPTLSTMGLWLLSFLMVLLVGARRKAV